MKISLKTGLVLLLVVLTLTRCVSFRKSDQSTVKQFKKLAYAPLVKRDTLGGKSIRYVHLITDNVLPTLVFVHGAPGSSNDFLDYLKDTSLSNHYNLICFDRLGYGYSQYGEYNDIKSQAALLSILLQKLNLGDTYLVGHSFGGPIVARMSFLMDIKATVMIAPALDPENEKYFWFGKIAYWKGTKWLTSKALQVAASEKYKHAQDLKEIENGWANINSPILHIHGDKDKLVPFVNLQYSKQYFPRQHLSTSVWEGKGHLIPFTEKNRMIKEIKEYLKKLNH